MTSPTNWADTFNAFKDRRILCIGDGILDIFVYGDVKGISREAPIPILQEEKRTLMPGGAGNLVRNIATAGAQVEFITVVGEDASAKEFAESLPQGVKAHFVTESKRMTAVKTRFMAGTQQLLCHNHEHRHEINSETHDKIITISKRLIGQVDAIVLSDYGRGMITDALVREIITLSKQKPVLVDPRTENFAKYAGATLITPNRNEFTQATGMEDWTPDELITESKKICEMHKIKNLVITQGPQGMTWVSKDGHTHHEATKAREVFDVSGAGDTVLSMFALAFAVGLEIPTAMRLATAAAGVVVGKKGTAVAYPSEILTALSDLYQHSGLYKICDRATAAHRVREWQDQGFRVGLTNGTFDLVHRGHLSSIAKAKAACDKLVMAINSDASVKKYKGPDRPIQDQDSRAAILANMENIDCVLIFDETTAEATLREVKPNVYIKGGDYTLDTLPETPTLKELGIEAVFTPIEEGFSTTRLVNKLKGAA